MKKRSQTPDDKDHPYSKRSKQATEKPTMKRGKANFENISPVARHHETMGVSKKQKKELEHSIGPKKSAKKMKHHPDAHDGHLNPLHHRTKKMIVKKAKHARSRVKKEGSQEMYA